MNASDLRISGALGQPHADKGGNRWPAMFAGVKPRPAFGPTNNRRPKVKPMKE
jgi:hypothetical protein